MMDMLSGGLTTDDVSFGLASWTHTFFFPLRDLQFKILHITSIPVICIYLFPILLQQAPTALRLFLALQHPLATLAGAFFLCAHVCVCVSARTLGCVSVKDRRWGVVCVCIPS